MLQLVECQVFLYYQSIFFELITHKQLLRQTAQCEWLASHNQFKILIQMFKTLIQFKFLIMLDFESCLENHSKWGKLFVDKTNFIKAFLSCNKQALLYVRPRRFGKSFNLSMLKSFFAAEYQIKGNLLRPKEKLENSKAVLFKGGEIKKVVNETTTQTITYTCLNIGEDQDFCNLYQGKYPVLKISFLSGSTKIEQFEDSLKEKISEVYTNHKYLWVQQIIPQLMAQPQEYRHEIEYLDNICKCEYSLQRKVQMLYRKFHTSQKILKIIMEDKQLKLFILIEKKRFSEISQIQFSQSILNLAKMMKKFYDQKVIVLIDQYDAGLLTSITNYINKYSEYEIQQRQKQKALLDHAGKLLTQVLMKCGKDQSQIIQKFALFGVSEVFVKVGQSGFNTLTIVPFGTKSATGQIFQQSFGFTQSELDALIDVVLNKRKTKIKGANIKKSILKQLKVNFNGYGQKGNVFNPWSCARHLEQILSTKTQKLPAPKRYWQSNSVNNLIKYLRVKRETYELLSKITIKTPLQKISVELVKTYEQWGAEGFMDQLINVMDIQNTQRIVSDKILFFLLNRCGYLMPVVKQQKLVGFRLPSKEIQQQFHRETLTSWIKALIGMKAQPLNIVQALSSNFYEQKPFLDVLRTQILALYQGDHAQADFASGIYGLLKLGSFTGYFSSHANMQVVVSGKRIDTLFLPKQFQKKKKLSKPLVIHEYKIEKDKNQQQDIMKKVQQALWQCFINDYLGSHTKISKTVEWNHVLVRGIVFWLDDKFKWNVDLKQYQIPKKNIDQIRGHFSPENLRQVLQKLGIQQSQKQKSRTKFLEKGESARKLLLQMLEMNSLDQLINQHFQIPIEIARAAYHQSFDEIYEKSYQCQFYDQQQDVMKFYPISSDEDDNDEQWEPDNEQKKIVKNWKEILRQKQEEEYRMYKRSLEESDSIILQRQMKGIPVVPNLIRFSEFPSLGNPSPAYKQQSNKQRNIIRDSQWQNIFKQKRQGINNQQNQESQQYSQQYQIPRQQQDYQKQ